MLNRWSDIKFPAADITWEAFMLHNGKDVDPVVLENVLMRFSTCKDKASAWLF